MALMYHNPETVVSPKKFISGLTILYDGGDEGFSLATLKWEGLEHIGVRWNVARKELDEPAKREGEIICNGAPCTKGIPSWFILPRELFNPVLFDKDSATFLELVKKWE